MPPKKKSAVKGRPKSANPMSKFVHVKCTPEWHAWLMAEAERMGEPVSVFLATAAEYRAFMTGGKSPPKR